MGAHPSSTTVFDLGFAFGPSRRTTTPLIRPLLISARRAPAFRPTRSVPPRDPTWAGHLGHLCRPPRIRPATFLAHPPRLRCGPLMASGFAVPCQLARTAPPSTRSTPAPRRAAVCHVFLGSRFCLGLPFHPALRRRSWLWLVVGAINLHRGLSPPARWSCRAYNEKPGSRRASHMNVAHARRMHSNR